MRKTILTAIAIAAGGIGYWQLQNSNSATGNESTASPAGDSETDSKTDSNSKAIMDAPDQEAVFNEKAYKQVSSVDARTAEQGAGTGESTVDREQTGDVHGNTRTSAIASDSKAVDANEPYSSESKSGEEPKDADLPEVLPDPEVAFAEFRPVDENAAEKLCGEYSGELILENGSHRTVSYQLEGGVFNEVFEGSHILEITDPNSNGMDQATRTGRLDFLRYAGGDNSIEFMFGDGNTDKNGRETRMFQLKIQPSGRVTGNYYLADRGHWQLKGRFQLVKTAANP